MTEPMMDNVPQRRGDAVAAAGLTLLIGLWYIASPWVYGFSNSNTWSVWNSVAIGALIALFALVRLTRTFPTPAARWLDLLLGAWAFFSPWIYGYVLNEGRFINSICVGVAVFLLSAWGLSVRPTPMPRP